MSSIKTSKYWMVWSLLMWVSRFRNTSAQVSFCLSGRSFWPRWSKFTMKSWSRCVIICDLIEWYKVMRTLEQGLHKFLCDNRINTYCRYDCQLIWVWRISLARICKTLVAAIISENHCNITVRCLENRDTFSQRLMRKYLPIFSSPSDGMSLLTFSSPIPAILATIYCNRVYFFQRRIENLYIWEKQKYEDSLSWEVLWLWRMTLGLLTVIIILLPSLINTARARKKEIAIWIKRLPTLSLQPRWQNSEKNRCDN